MASKKRAVPEINAGSMADIAFLLLIFFLVTTTMDVDTGIARVLPPMPDEEQPLEDVQANKRNIFQVLVNAYDQLLVNGEVLKVEDLKDKTIEFIDNNGDGTCGYCNGKRNPDLSDNPDKAIVSLQNDRGTSYDMYIRVQNEMAQAYRELRDRESMEKFGLSFEKLNNDQQKEIQKMFPQKISEAEPKNVGK
jgi:biopolymer transport protein ExbD